MELLGVIGFALSVFLATHRFEPLQFSEKKKKKKVVSGFLITSCFDFRARYRPVGFTGEKRPRISQSERALYRLCTNKIHVIGILANVI